MKLSVEIKYSRTPEKSPARGRIQTNNLAIRSFGLYRSSTTDPRLAPNFFSEEHAILKLLKYQRINQKNIG